MWLFSLLPDSLMFIVVITITLVGMAGYLSSSFGGVIPSLKPHANALKLVSIVVMLVGVYLYGCYSADSEWKRQSDVLKQKVTMAEEKSKTATAEVVIRYKDRIKVIHDTKVVTKEVLKEKIVAIDNCSIPDVITVLNKAAARPLNLSLPTEIPK
jgi:hypothetical protein